MEQHTEYPYQVYSYKDSRRLTVVNLAVNEYQSVIDLNQKQFLTFVQTDQQTNGWRDDSNELQTFVYLIVVSDAKY